MAGDVLAYTVAAGTMTLALSTTYLAWRTRTKLARARDQVRSELYVKDTMLSELDAATAAFDEAFLAVEGDAVRLVWGEETLRRCAEALGLKQLIETRKIADCAPQVVAVRLVIRDADREPRGLDETQPEGRKA